MPQSFYQYNVWITQNKHRLALLIALTIYFMMFLFQEISTFSIHLHEIWNGSTLNPNVRTFVFDEALRFMKTLCSLLKWGSKFIFKYIQKTQRFNSIKNRIFISFCLLRVLFITHCALLFACEFPCVGCSFAFYCHHFHCAHEKEKAIACVNFGRCDVQLFYLDTHKSL